MNDRHVRRQVLDTITKEQVIANGNVVGTLLGKAKGNRQISRDEIVDAVYSLQRTGHIGVAPNATGGIDRVYVKQSSPKVKEKKEFADRTDYGFEAKRQSAFARGIPAHLPDSMCSPVTIIKREDRQLPTPNDMPAKKPDSKEDSVKSTVQVNAPEKRTLLEELNLAWVALRKRADKKTGQLPIGCVVAFLVEDLQEYGISENRAAYLNQMLAKLDLRKTVNLGFPPKGQEGPRAPRYQTTVDLDTEVITQETMRKFKFSPASVEPIEKIAETVPVTVDSKQLASGSVDVVKELIRVVKGLEGVNQEAQDEILRLRSQLETEQTKNSKLENELANLRAAPTDPEAISILEKYKQL